MPVPALTASSHGALHCQSRHICGVKLQVDPSVLFLMQEASPHLAAHACAVGAIGHVVFDGQPPGGGNVILRTRSKRFVRLSFTLLGEGCIAIRRIDTPESDRWLRQQGNVYDYGRQIITGRTVARSTAYTVFCL